MPSQVAVTGSERSASLRRILLIDDEPRILDFVARGLRSEGFEVDVASSGVHGREMALSGRYDVIVLDLLMPGLDLGADDYLTKPFVLDELIARIRARLRAHTRSSVPKLVAGHLTLDVVRREADAGSGPVALAEREFLLLQELMKNAGATVSKERLLNSVWGYNFDPGTNVLDVYVRRLRAKLGSDLIQTVRGAGYRVGSS